MLPPQLWFVPKFALPSPSPAIEAVSAKLTLLLINLEFSILGFHQELSTRIDLPNE